MSNKVKTIYWKNLIVGSKKNFSLNAKVDLIKYPVFTVKTLINLFKRNEFTFDVDPRLSKPQIKKLFENLFNIKILTINTHIPPRKKLRVGFTQGYRPRYKRVIITLKKNQFLNYNL
uniref:Large ribosomal subunit protein uL23c n=1 Tax=Oogamochlamys gigantea TaxID=158507 RepID=A0A0S2LMW4_9CHLO|nr:ribosomal protein L23 [Oogamochlamys gigantea]ALO62805.1 ribosomal protein L23 [Oogamochlamys gigantea]